MVETHIHILHGVDDGARSLQESIEMVRFAYDEGVRDIILTPHYRTKKYENEKVLEKFKELKENLECSEFDGLNLHLGNEIYLNENTVKSVLEGDAFSMAESTYLLIELPTQSLYPVHMEVLFRLNMEGYKLIIAHVDRYEYLVNNEKKLTELVQIGHKLQITASFITGFHTRGKAIKWIKNGWIHFVASDAHNMANRKPKLKKAYQVVSKKIGHDVAENLFKKNGLMIINESKEK